jgi:hypothetical protein
VTPPAWHEYAAAALAREQERSLFYANPWPRLLADLVFVAELEQGIADLEAGRSTPWREIRESL